MSKPLVAIVMGSQQRLGNHAAGRTCPAGFRRSVRFTRHLGASLARSAVRLHQGNERARRAMFYRRCGRSGTLAGVIAGKTTLPVLGVPIPSKYLKGMDSLLSIVQMPKGIPVATFAIGEAGAANAGLFAVSMLALNDKVLAQKLADYRKKQAEQIAATTLPTLVETKPLLTSPSQGGTWTLP